MSAADSPGTMQHRAPIVQVLRPLAVAGMLTCIAVSLAQLVESIDPSWPGSVLIWLTLLFSLESMHAYGVLMARNVSERDRGRFRFVEWVVLLLVVRFAFYLGKPAGSLVGDLWRWSDDPMTFFDLGYVVTSLLLAGFWSAALVMAHTLTELDMAQDEAHVPDDELSRYLWQTMPHHGQHDRSALLQRIHMLVLSGGIVMIVLSGFARVDVRAAVHLEHARTSGIIFNVLLYFGLGLLLISQSQYAALRARWDLDRVPILDRVGKRWMWAAIALLLLVGGVAALLPVGYSVGLLDAIGLVLSWIWYVVLQIISIIVFIVSMLFSLIASLFTGETVDSSFELQTPPDLPAEAAAAAGGGGSWWLLVRSLLFWAVLIGLVGYSLVGFLRDRWGLFQGHWLAAWLERMRGFFGRARADLGETLRRLESGLREWRAARGRGQEDERTRFFSLRHLSARDQVRYFYLSTLRRAEQAGVPRAPTQTPAEYRQVLSSATPEPDSVAMLTEAFEVARYSAAPVDEQETATARGAWQRIKRALQRRKRGHQS